MNAVDQHLAALRALYAPSPNELREAVNAGIARAADLGRSLTDQHAVETLLIQWEGVARTLRQLGPMLAAEANPDART